jgi:hypothetical protein
MMTLGVLVGAVALLVLVFYWSGRYGDPKRSSGTSLQRGSRAHTTRNGRPKKAYVNRDQAEARAKLMSARDGAPMGVYQCSTCAKWHVGHEQ